MNLGMHFGDLLLALSRPFKKVETSVAALTRLAWSARRITAPMSCFFFFKDCAKELGVETQALLVVTGDSRVLGLLCFSLADSLGKECLCLDKC